MVKTIKIGIMKGRMALRNLVQQKIENWCIILCHLLRATSLAYQWQCSVVSFIPGVLHPPDPLLQTALLYSSLCNRNLPQGQCVAQICPAYLFIFFISYFCHRLMIKDCSKNITCLLQANIHQNVKLWTFIINIKKCRFHILSMQHLFSENWKIK